MKPEYQEAAYPKRPYLLFVYLFDKVGQAVRLSPGDDLSAKLLSLGRFYCRLFKCPPSFAPMDLLIGIVGAVCFRLDYLHKGKNGKKYRLRDRIRFCALGQRLTI